MSLVVWLPMTKDLRNQGLDDITITNSGATYSATGGKLGGCYVFDGSDDSIGIGNLSTLVNTDFTFACWFYHDNTWSSKGYETLLGGPSGFELESKVSTTNSPVLKLYNWGGGSCIYELNKWNHVVFTRNTTETKLYLNGELQVTGTAGTIPSGDYFIGAWKTSAQQNFKGNMNDVRIYDHCLSPMEVKQLSQGLILHYSLSDPLIESTTNLASTSTGGWNNSGAATRLSNDTTLNETKPTAGPVTSIKITTAGNCALTCGTTAATYPSKTLTFSIWCYLSGPQENNVIYIRSTKTDGNVGNFDYKGKTDPSTWPLNKWIRLEKTITTASDATTFYFCTYANKLNRYIALNGWQIEEKSCATPWTPPGTTRNSNNNIYDSSGFCNNGELYAYDQNGSITINNDTPKYSVSTHIASANPSQDAASGTRYLYGHCSLTNPTQMSVAFWLKPITGGYGGTTSNGQGYFCTTNYEYGNTSIGSDYQASAMNHRDGAVNMNDSASTTQCNVTFYPTIGEWHHYVYTYDGQVGRGYKDGVQTATAQFSAAKTLDSFIGVVIGFSRAGGVWRRNDACYSDFRIYATALSASDVLSLYQNSAYIDSSGNVYGAVHSEV